MSQPRTYQHRRCIVGGACLVVSYVTSIHPAPMWIAIMHKNLTCLQTSDYRQSLDCPIPLTKYSACLQFRRAPERHKPGRLALSTLPRA